MGDLDGRTFLITGANTGIGKETARGLANRGARVLLACRSAENGRRAIDEIAGETGNEQLELLSLDLGDLASVRACADAFLAREEPLHVLINNAGLAGGRGMTASGFELAFGTNHIGPFLLTSLLLDRLRESAPARIVNVASVAHFGATGIDFQAVRNPTRSVTGRREYAVSKLANVLHAQELARTSLYCATAPELVAESGRYYDDCAVTQPSKAVTASLAEELLQRSADWVAPG